MFIIIIIIFFLMLILMVRFFPTGTHIYFHSNHRSLQRETKERRTSNVHVHTHNNNNKKKTDKTTHNSKSSLR